MTGNVNVHTSFEIWALREWLHSEEFGLRDVNLNFQ